MRNLKLIGLFILIGFYSSCNNDDDNNNTQILSGIYTETSPVNGRSQLNFVSGNKVIKSEPENSTEDEFTYELLNNVIKLTPTFDNATTTEFEIDIVNKSKFEIENLYPSIPEDPSIYMTFEK